MPCCSVSSSLPFVFSLVLGEGIKGKEQLTSLQPGLVIQFPFALQLLKFVVLGAFNMKK